MAGMNSTTGRTLSGVGHIQQSVRDVLTTPIGSRVMRRDYGSLLPELLDQPMNDANLLRAYAASVIAILRWEPRIRVKSIRRSVVPENPGTAVFSIEAQTRSGDNVTLEVATP
jgi:phage baseplate assembly protein W